MSISHGATTRAAMCEAAVRPIDAGASFGKLKFLSATNTLICTITLPKPAFGSASGASQLLLGVPLTGAIIATDTIAKFYLTDSNDLTATTIQGTVGTSGADINLSEVSVGTGSSIQIDSLSYTAAT